MISKRIIFLNLLLAITLFSCGNDDEQPTRDSFVTQPATDITSETATLNGKFTVGEIEMLDCGFYYSTVSNRNLTGYIKVSIGVLNTDGTFSLNLEELEPNTTYYFRTYVMFDLAGPVGSELSFTTPAAE